MNNFQDITSRIKDSVDDVASSRSILAKDALSDLESGETELLGVTLNAEKAAANFEAATELVRAYGKDVDLNIDEIRFESLSGNMVGEARHEGVFLDPEVLKYSPLILAKVLYHELRHKNKLVMNEGMVEAGVELRFGADSAEHPYQEMVKNFLEFARRFDVNGDAEAGESRIYQLYVGRQIEDIYQGYKKNYIDGLEDDAAKDRAFQFFTSVFPELNYGGKRPGYFDVEEETGAEVLPSTKMGPAQETADKVQEVLTN